MPNFLCKTSFLGLFLGGSLFFGNAFAVSTVEGDINEDLYFPDGVLILGVDKPDNSVKTTGSSQVSLGGVGTLTVGNQSGGGFPRITVLGGTTITSTRSWAEEDALRIAWWEGQFSAPTGSRAPQLSEVNYPNIPVSSQLQVVDAFTFGLNNESFQFSPAATVALPAQESDGKKLWIAYKKSDNEWLIDQSTSCVVHNQICVVSINKASSVALVREIYGLCPVTQVANGKVSSPPHCSITCNNGYTLDESVNACVDIHSEAGEALKGSAYDIPERTQYSARQGYYRYLGTREPEMRELNQDLMDPSMTDRARHLNRSFWGRNPKSVEEQTYQPIETPRETPEQRDSFLNYLQQMRNNFGAGSSPNMVATLQPTETEENSPQEEDTDVTDNYHSSGTPLLPSTGPEMFIIIAIVGFSLMILAARRRG